MKRTAILIAALTSVLLSTQALAQRSGPAGYLGFGFGSVASNGASFFSNTINEDTVAGGKVYAGFMRDAHWGMEIGLHNLGTFDAFLLGVKTDEWKATAVSVVGVYTTPIAAGYSFIGRLGLAFTNVEYDCIQGCGGTVFDNKKRGTSGLIGFGVGAQLWQNVQVRFDYEHIGSVRHMVGNTEYQDPYDTFSVNLVFQY